MNKPDCIIQKHIPVNIFSRSGKHRFETLAIDMHWNGNAGMDEETLAKYLHDLSNQIKDDNIPDRFAGANYCVGQESSIEIVPPDEITYTAGADGIKTFYTGEAKEYFGEKYTKYWPESNGLSPNTCTCSLELVHTDSTGKFEPSTLENAALTVAWLVSLYNLSDDDNIITHNFITGKDCPRYWVNHPPAFEEFKEQVSSIVRNPPHSNFYMP
tara:strand:- start:781 stop:1419 length:639 start_codon:yes stop_codon:yes gene_type:complete